MFCCVFTFLTLGYSIRETNQHLKNYFQPRIQKHIVRILMMPVIYSIDCTVSLYAMDLDPYVHLVREQYEAYSKPNTLCISRSFPPLSTGLIRSLLGTAVWSFNALMVEFLTNVAIDRKRTGNLRTSEDSLRASRSARLFSLHQHLPQFQLANERYQENEQLLVRLLEQEDHDPHHMFPFNFLLQPWTRGQKFLTNCRNGVLQYVAYSSSMSIVNLALELTGNFHEGDLSLRSGYLYVILIRSLSQTWALYCLVLFYHATAELLAPIRPFPKFVAIKLVVFATFWQGIVIDVIIALDLLPISAWRYQVRRFALSPQIETSAVQHAPLTLCDHDRWANVSRETRLD